MQAGICKRAHSWHMLPIAYNPWSCVSYNDLTRLASAVNDPLKLPDERLLFQFSESSDFDRWRTFQDSDMGGESIIGLAANPEFPVSQSSRP